MGKYLDLEAKVSITGETIIDDKNEMANSNTYELEEIPQQDVGEKHDK